MVASGQPPVLLTSREVSGPVTTGFLHTTIIVPPDAEQWSESDQRAVLSHEVAHSARRDCLSQLVARLAVVLHWPNPLAWWAERRMRAEREMAADDGSNIGHKVALLTGDRVLASPVIKSTIGKHVQITPPSAGKGRWPPRS
jgi:hypothetical protein